MSPARRRKAVTHVVSQLGVSERRACKALGQSRSSQRYQAKPDEYREKLRHRIVELASEFGRYGYRQIRNLLEAEGWQVGKDAVYSIWRQEGLKVPQKQPKRKRLWLADGSCIRKRPMFRHHAWSYDFVHDRTHHGTPFRILNIIDEFSRE